VSPGPAPLTFAANLSMLFSDVPLIDRFARAKAAGFRAVEVQFLADTPVDRVKQELDRHGLALVLLNFDVGDFKGGDRGYLNDPAKADRLQRAIDEGLATARRLGVPRMNAMAGNLLPGVPEAVQQATIVESLRKAAPAAASAGVTILVEALNRFDHPRYTLTTSAATLEIMRRVNQPNVKFQYDTFHMQRMEGNLTETVTKNLGWIGHIQVADVPGRHEPGTGEINFPFFFRALAAAGYPGVVGLEYVPSGPTEATLGWLKM
jgi:hydroxypyruvate isomerase